MSPEQLANKDSRTSHVRNQHRKKNTDISSVGVIGLGYVGLPLAILSSSRGYHVTGFDIDEVKVAQLESREANFLTDEEADLFRSVRLLTITSDPGNLRNLDAYIVCVPTPVHHNHEPDLRPIESAATILGKVIGKASLVCIESTVNPGVCEEVVLPILEKESGLSRNEFFFAHCPERINPGDDRWNVSSIPRVLGAINTESVERAVQLYRTIIDAEIRKMATIKEAEAVKMVENSFRDINIAFVNELAMSFDKAGIDIVNVIKGASTKPFGFLAHYPGCGVGGHCIPVDPYYLIRYGHENGFEHQFLITARRINNRMPIYTVTLLVNALKDRRKMLGSGKKNLQGATVALLGLSYKRDIPDIRESPSLVIQSELKKRGVTVRVFDPYVLSQSSVRTLEDALQGSDAVIIATDHTAFCSLTPRHFEEAGVSIVIDGRNCLKKEDFTRSSVTYRGIGRR